MAVRNGFCVFLDLLSGGADDTGRQLRSALNRLQVISKIGSSFDIRSTDTELMNDLWYRDFFVFGLVG